MIYFLIVYIVKYLCIIKFSFVFYITKGKQFINICSSLIMLRGKSNGEINN